MKIALVFLITDTACLLMKKGWAEAVSGRPPHSAFMCMFRQRLHLLKADHLLDACGDRRIESQAGSQIV